VRYLVFTQLVQPLSIRLRHAEVIVYSDALDVEKCLELRKASDEAGVGCSFGVGTYFTNGASSSSD